MNSDVNLKQFFSKALLLTSLDPFQSPLCTQKVYIQGPHKTTLFPEPLSSFSPPLQSPTPLPLFLEWRKKRETGARFSEEMSEDESVDEEVSKACLPLPGHFPEYSRTRNMLGWLLNNLVRGFPKISKQTD